MNTDFVKFPSTPYLFSNEKMAVRYDKVLSLEESNQFFCENVIIEEKVDGANLGISFDSNGDLLLQSRGNYLITPFNGQWKPLIPWIANKEQALFEVLLDRYILFGEWCYLTHSVYYNALPDWFLAFDIYDKQEGCFLPQKKRNNMFETMEIKRVPLIAIGCLSKTELLTYLGTSFFSKEKSEGLYLRIENDNRVLKRAKLVRSDFIQSIDVHWKTKKPQKNQLAL